MNDSIEGQSGTKINPRPSILTNFCLKCHMKIMAFSPNQPETVCVRCKWSADIEKNNKDIRDHFEQVMTWGR